MSSPNEKLADALEKLSAAQVNGILRHDALTRTYRERLSNAGFLAEICKGWYYVSSPGPSRGSTAWFGHFLEFARQYLNGRFGGQYCLTAEASLLLHGGSPTIPDQLGVMSPKGDNKTLNLPSGLSIFIYQDLKNFPVEIGVKRGLNVMPLADALVRVPESFFRNRPSDAAVILRIVTDPTPVLAILLDQGRSTVAGRLAGAFREIGYADVADQVLSTMKAADFDVRESNPFVRHIPMIETSRNPSPYEVRIRSMWMQMRQPVIDTFPPAPGLPSDPAAYMAEVDEIYAADAYNSLSIEGYRVTAELIERVKAGNWNPDGNEEDRGSKDALAARGYFEAFEAVRQTVEQLIRGESMEILRRSHRTWYQALFAPTVRAGILRVSDLAGYRNHPVYINGSRHVPLPADALMDAMQTLFDLLEEEPEASVRAVLGHFIFVFIHPYGDGNGRIGRFLMNAMLASGGYPWTVIQLVNRPAYMRSLETTSVAGDIRLFAEFVASEMLGPPQN